MKGADDVTNRETAIALWRKLLQQSEDDPSSEKPESWPDEWRPIKSALDAAERRGWIAALYWALDNFSAPRIADKLEQLEAEDAKR